MKLILITGAAGGVARMIRPILRKDYRLRLSDRLPVADAVAGEEVAQADLGDITALRKAVQGVDGIVHLGGRAVEDDWEVIHQANIVGLYNLYEAARLEGVKRVVFASTNHTVGFYKRNQTIGTNVTLRPDTRYGASKVFGEAIGSLYAEKYGAEVLNIRIGNAAERPGDLRRLSIWVSPRDLCQLIRIGLDHPAVKNEVVYGVSDNKRAWWDNANAYRLGYRPMDRSETFAEEILAADGGKTGDDRVDLNQGGIYCIAEKL